ncbi:hypothetical protein [Allomesorhizobium camelthorni]|uniref:Uncharacterized protein n=1 Tax=Allomesorhizobium camelthorni TaxID=475069 RepID=A0A6G4WAH2_9HYPH|nr:hypothetical protein [Mesorhizobium camelthorni]NGO51599.1 hypothetical protein [Mesorhizobium camelthorni]
MTGRYIVTPFPIDTADPEDIAFQLTAEALDIPEEQGILKSEVERTLIVLRGIFDPSDRRFKSYFAELLALSRYGLIGPTAQPKQALDTLGNLQKRIFDMEKGRIISQHMTTIILRLALFLSSFLMAGFLAVSLAPLAGFAAPALREVQALVFVLPGLLIGLAFSSFLRCRAVTFFDLHAIDADRFSPFMRGAFALVVLIISAAFLKAGVFEILVGDVRLSSFDADGLSAFVFGAVVGFAQEPIISRIESIGKGVGKEP